MNKILLVEDDKNIITNLSEFLCSENFSVIAVGGQKEALSKIDAGTTNFKKEKVLVSDVITKAFDPIAIPMEIREQQLVVDAKGDEALLGDLA